MNPKFQAAVHQKEDVSYVKLSGVIDEDNDLGALAEKLSTETAVIDLSEIERINSCGVRDWVNWLGRVEKGGTRKIVLVECSPSIVAQINLVSNFTGGGVVKSFFAPYFCGNCDREKVLLVETRDMAGRQPFKAPSCRCDECDGPMDFDDMEESFFAFLGNTKKIVVDGSVDAALSEFGGNTSSAERKLKLRGSPISNPGLSGPATAAAGGSTQLTPAPLPASPRTVTGSFSRSGPGMLTTTTSGQKWPPLAPDDLSAARRLSPPPPEPRSAGAWILVGVLVAAAIALLAYVFLSGGSRPGHALTGRPAPAAAEPVAR